MKHRIPILIVSLALLTVMLSACFPGIPNTGGDTDPGKLLEAAQATATMSAMQTEIVRLQTEVAQGGVSTQSPESTSTQVPPTVTATATQVPPTPTASATATLVPTATAVPPTPTATPIPIPCNAAVFVEDISVPDGMEVTSGMSFTKTWRLQNVGACTWTSDYALTFYDGEQMNAPAVMRLPRNVAPGQVIDLSVDLTAPGQAGVYRSYWMLRDPYGVLFGFGRSGEAIFAEVRVRTPTDINWLSFVDSYCLAEWTTGAGRIPCQGQSGDSRGYVRRIENPVLESGYTDDEPVLLTQPQMVQDGIIRGRYPTMRIENGWRFVSIIGCANKAEACDVKFQLDYQIAGGSIQTLATWKEVYDGEFHQADVDLSSLAGKDVNLILTVFANGSPHQDQAQWLAPHITTAVEWQDQVK
jgi:hypothetical protein